MNSPSPSPSPTEAVASSRRALAQGNHAEARERALFALRMDPRSEEAWLLLAALASPKTRARYLDHLLLIHPDSQAARRALEELASNQSFSTSIGGMEDLPLPEEILASANVAVAIPAPLLEKSSKGKSISRFSNQEKTTERQESSFVPSAAGSGRASRRRIGVRWGTLLLSVSCILALTATAFINVVSYAQEPPILARVEQDRGTLPPSFTPSSTPTITPSFTPTFTSTFTPSPTSTASPTPPPTPTEYFPPILGSGGERWIDVDISAQRVIAYEGNTPVGSFIVSTGTAAHPTVLGRFRIYVKYRYNNMAGPGYYLPNVPYVMYFYSGYSLHGTYWHHNFGTPMSHGCINMRTSDAEWLFYWASVGTVVNVHW